MKIHLGAVATILLHLVALFIIYVAVVNEDAGLYLLAVIIEVVYWILLHRRWNP